MADRPEARWAFWAGLAGLLGGAALHVKAILGSASSSAAIGFIFVPLVAAVAAAVAGTWGLALGHVVARLRGRVAEPWIVFWVALPVALAFPAAGAYEVWRGLALEREVREVRAMSATELERALETSPWRDDKFFLAALAGRKDAPAHLLERIAQRDEPELFEPLGSLWDVKGENRKGLAVMRLVARNPSTPAQSLARLEAHPRSEEVITEVLANPNTPAAVIEKHARDTDYRAEWGLAVNPRAPRAVLERLSRSENLYSRLNLTYNAAVPQEILERLAADREAMVAARARDALERRKATSSSPSSGPSRPSRP
jgi:hypothetical protein